MVRTNGQEWKILNGSCPELAGTQWDGKPEYCPILTVVAEPDVDLPGTAIRASVQTEIDSKRNAESQDGKRLREGAFGSKASRAGSERSIPSSSNEPKSSDVFRIKKKGRP
jgi:hypothetical protein